MMRLLFVNVFESGATLGEIPKMFACCNKYTSDLCCTCQNSNLQAKGKLMVQKDDVVLSVTRGSGLRLGRLYFPSHFSHQSKTLQYLSEVEQGGAL